MRPQVQPALLLDLAVTDDAMSLEDGLNVGLEAQNFGPGGRGGRRDPAKDPDDQHGYDQAGQANEGNASKTAHRQPNSRAHPS